MMDDARMAQKLRTEAEAMKAEYEQNLQNARTEANQIVASGPEDRHRPQRGAAGRGPRPGRCPEAESRRPTLRRSARRP